VNSVLNNNKSEAIAVIKIRTDEEKLIGTVYGKDRVRQEVLAHGLGGGQDCDVNFMFEFPCYYIKDQQDATLAVCLLVTARLHYMFIITA
jgi:hypothetical protein